MLDPRKWFLLQRRPGPSELTEIEKVVAHVPNSDVRCPEVMQVYHAGWQTGFKLTDERGQPTNALRVMVWKMDAALCQADDLAPEEKKHFTHHKGVIDPVFKGRWFIRDVSRRLRADTLWASEGSGYYSGPYFRMFKTDQHLGLLHKNRVTQMVGGEKVRTHLYLVVCPPNWELTDDVYNGLYRWHGYDVRRLAYNAYPYLAELEWRWALATKEVLLRDGHAEVVSPA